MGNHEGMVLITAAELDQLVRKAVRDELAQGSTTPDYLTTEQVAELLGCVRESVSTYCTRDGLPCVRIGRIRRFRREDVLAWLEERSSKPRAHAGRHAKTLATVRQLKPAKE